MMSMNLKSVKVMTVIVPVCMALVIAVAVCAPWLISLYGDFRNISAAARLAILVSYYSCTVPVLEQCVLAELIGDLADIGYPIGVRHDDDLIDTVELIIALEDIGEDRAIVDLDILLRDIGAEASPGAAHHQ